MALGLVAAGAVLLRQATLLPIGWSAIGPGAGFFPFWLSIGVTVTAVALLVQSVRAPRHAAGEGAFLPSGAWKPLLAVFLPIVAIIALLRYLGVYVGGVLYLAGYMRLVGRHSWGLTAVVSLLVPLALFMVFEQWFLMPLPKGTLLELLLYGR